MGHVGILCIEIVQAVEIIYYVVNSMAADDLAT